MRTTPSMHSLRVFEAASRLMSFKEAADELCVTPAAVSNQIHKLEEYLGVRLFKRFNRRIELTDAGTKYLVRMRLIFDDIEDATRDVMQKGEASVISFAAPPTLLKSWLIPNIKNFYSSYPNINIRFVDTLRYLEFEKEQIDLAIRYGLGGWDDLQQDYLFPEDVCPACSPKLIEGEYKLLEPSDLVNFRLIYTERRLVQWDNYLASAGYEKIPIRNKLWFLNSIHTLEAALNGVGVALINKHLIQDHLESGELIIPFELKMDLSRKPGYYLVSPKESSFKKEIDIFRNWILDLSPINN
ncbi:LysR family glycine cleavage system transcriptional activator [Marinobacterium sp. MBR-111]|uniref:LysR substrate-binding domain-containing protein n=1 Tax=Marinobacterium sp. MBR-111 TaxID=3156463 RepID=UPI0033978286